MGIKLRMRIRSFIHSFNLLSFHSVRKLSETKELVRWVSQDE